MAAPSSHSSRSSLSAACGDSPTMKRCAMWRTPPAAATPSACRPGARSGRLHRGLDRRRAVVHLVEVGAQVAGQVVERARRRRDVHQAEERGAQLGVARGHLHRLRVHRLDRIARGPRQRGVQLPSDLADPVLDIHAPRTYSAPAPSSVGARRRTRIRVGRPSPGLAREIKGEPMARSKHVSVRERHRVARALRRPRRRRVRSGDDRHQGRRQRLAHRWRHQERVDPQQGRERPAVEGLRRRTAAGGRDRATGPAGGERQPGRDGPITAHRRAAWQRHFRTRSAAGAVIPTALAALPGAAPKPAGVSPTPSDVKLDQGLDTLAQPPARFTIVSKRTRRLPDRARDGSLHCEGEGAERQSRVTATGQHRPWPRLANVTRRDERQRRSPSRSRRCSGCTSGDEADLATASDVAGGCRRARSSSPAKVAVQHIGA